MIKRIAHIVLSLWLAVLLIFGGTAKEFIHLFADHTDTVDCHYHHDGLVIEPEHHHCSFLQFSLTSFLNDVRLPYVSAHYIRHISRYHSLLVSIQERSPLTVSLRGPPMV